MCVRVLCAVLMEAAHQETREQDRSKDKHVPTSTNLSLSLFHFSVRHKKKPDLVVNSASNFKRRYTAAEEWKYRRSSPVPTSGRRGRAEPLLFSKDNNQQKIYYVCQFIRVPKNVQL